MAIWFELDLEDPETTGFQYNLNEYTLGTVQIRRTEKLDITNPPAIADVVSVYHVTVGGHPVGDVYHRYGDGAWKLLEIAASLIANHPEYGAKKEAYW